MPFYQYKCNNCNKLFTLHMTFQHYDKSKKHQIECQYCHSLNTIRTYEPPTIIYRGSGFYSTENKDTKDV